MSLGEPVIYKRTTPFRGECEWFKLAESGVVLDACHEIAFIGFYYHEYFSTMMISLCEYHALVQESLVRIGLTK